MLEYQLVVLEGFIEQEFSAIMVDSKISMGFIKTATGNYRAMKREYDSVESGISLYENLNANSKKYARLNSRKYDVYLITDATSINIEDADAEVYNGNKIAGNFLGYDVFIRDENTLCACIRFNESNEYCIEGSMQNWPDIAIDKSIDSVRKILTSDRAKLVYDVEEAIIATITLMKYCIISIYRKNDSVNKDRMMRCFTLANDVVKLVTKAQEENKLSDNIGHYDKAETLYILNSMKTMIRSYML